LFRRSANDGASEGMILELSWDESELSVQEFGCPMI